MIRRPSRTVLSLAAMVVGFALLAAACGGGGGGSSTTTSSTTTTSSGGGKNKPFSVFRVTWDAPDYFDPGLSYTVTGWQIIQHVFLGAYGYKQVGGPAGATVVPTLAEALPTISADGKDYKFTLRSGLTYSDGSPVKASDFKASIERLYKVDSPGVGFFDQIQGADTFAKTKKGGISGIIANDANRTVEIKLTSPRGDFLNILGIPFAAILPASTPAKDQSTTPPPATGPYEIQSYSPNRSFVLVRNPKFDASKIPEVYKGNPDKLQGTIVSEDAAALQTVLSGKSDYDFRTIPSDRLQAVKSQHGDQLRLYIPANTYYFAMNVRTPPFDKLPVRQAVNYAIDRNALVNLFGGLGKPTQNILPPTYPQYQKIDFYHHDLAKAKQLIKSAGATGAKVTVWGLNENPSQKATAYMADVLNKIGLKATPKFLSHGVYFTTIGDQKTKAQIMYTDWYQDYPHPLDWFDVLFNGNRITQTHNNNVGNADFKDVNATIERLKKINKLTPQVNSEWAGVDKDLVVKYASSAPYLNSVQTDFFSTKVDMSCYFNHVLFFFDWTKICLK
jgi:peptide/nickel transport system substrate-binding protein